MKGKSYVLLLLTLTLGFPVWAGAQESLGDIARKQQEERAKASKKAVKVYTNENLPARPPGEGPTASSGLSSTPAQGPSTAESSGQQPATGTAETPKQTGTEGSAEDKMKTKDYWQGKFKAARAELAKAEEEQQVVEDELNLLQIQQARELDPTAQNEVNGKVDARKAEAESKRATTAKARQALDDLTKEFNDSGAPEDWSKTE
jgi:hypothetical protein